MKKLTTILAIIFSITLFTECAKDPNHSIRVKNSYSVAVDNLKVNSTNYGTVQPNSTTDYKPVSEGNFTVSGSTGNGQTLTGSGTVSGKGTHQWTMTVTSSGDVDLAEDK